MSQDKYQFKNNEIVVALIDQTSVDGEECIKVGTVDKVSIAGSTGKYNSSWVIGFIHRKKSESFYNCSTDAYFRAATDDEIAQFNKVGRYIKHQPKFKMGDKLEALEDISTELKEYTIKKGDIQIVEDLIIDGKNIDDSIFWFNGHKGVFRMNDNFKLIE